MNFLSEINKLLKLTIPRPYSNVFSDFPEILRPRKRDLKNTHSTFWGYSMHFHAFFRHPFSKQLYVSTSFLLLTASAGLSFSYGMYGPRLALRPSIESEKNWSINYYSDFKLSMKDLDHFIMHSVRTLDF